MTVAHAQAMGNGHVPQPSDLKLSLDLLSDAGPDTDSYVKNLVANLRQHWIPLATDAAIRPLTEPQETLITLTIAPDGHLLAMQLGHSTRDAALDKAAWAATKDTTYAPTPTGMRDPNLKLRVHFVVE